MRAGREIRSARTDRGLSLDDAGRATNLSASTVSRIERGLIRHVSVVDLARLHAVVGLELSVKSYPGGQPIRDAAHVSLLQDFRAGLHGSLAWSVEVPLPIPGDRRAWDGVVQGPGWRYGVEAETAPRDSQSLARRLSLKQRDGDVTGVLLVLRPTAQTRRFLAEVDEALRVAFPANGRRAAELLAAGVDPGGNAIILVPPRRSAGPGFAARASNREGGPVRTG
ncbi:MAG: helix-turn-helix domain-containing protein [Candidatus Limnocylindrales bacterium]